jgi:Rho GDP-dissociation inhibitor
MNLNLKLLKVSKWEKRRQLTNITSWVSLFLRRLSFSLTTYPPIIDQNDESLKKWKESLLGAAGNNTTTGDPSDPRTCVIVSLGLEVEGRPDIILELDKPNALETLKDKPFTIKEGSTFRMKVQFRVQNQILAGLKYVQIVKRMGISHKTQEMVGSYAPNPADKPTYEKKCKQRAINCKS